MGRRPLFAVATLFFALFSARGAAAGTADLRFTTGTVGTGIPGGYVGLEVEFSNHGPSDASDFKVTIAIPAGATYDGSYFATSGVACDGPVGSAGNVICTAPSLAATPNPAGSYTGIVDLTPQIDPSTPPGTVLTFQVTMTASNALQPSQSATAPVTVVTPADLAVTATAPAAVSAGGTIVTNITLTNNGPGDAIDLSVGYSASSGVRMTGPDGWDCSAVTSCKAGSFPLGTATFVATFPVPASWSGSVRLKSSAFSANDPHFLDNTVTTTTAIGPNRHRAARH
jgi:hypothetical protein